MVSAVQGSIIAREVVSSGQGGRSCQPGENRMLGDDSLGLCTDSLPPIGLGYARARQKNIGAGGKCDKSVITVSLRHGMGRHY
jgi:hypothetical protein